MDKLEKFRQIVQKVLLPYCGIKYANGDFQNKPVFDRENDSYLIVSQGWEKNGKRHHDCLIDIEIRNGKLWIQCDGSPYGIANELEQEGIAKSEIVLAFHEPEVLKFTEYAIA